MATSERFKRTVVRFARETFWLRTHHNALKALSNLEAVGLDFFRVAHVGIQGDRLIRLIRLLEEDTRVASFWYLHRCEQKRVEAILAQNWRNDRRSRLPLVSTEANSGSSVCTHRQG